MYKVLVVDDERLIRKRVILGFDWGAMGYEVAGEAGTGAEALAMLRAGQIDLAIVDIAMPGMDGIEMIHQLRREGIETEVILLTGHSDFHYARDALQQGVFDYILKPLNEAEFAAVLSRLKLKLDDERSRQDAERVLKGLLLGQPLQGDGASQDAAGQIGRGMEAARKTQQHILDHFCDQTLSVQRIADEMGVSTAYISTAFKKVMGMSATRYITMLRLEKAKALFESGETSVRRVAEACGYADEFYFSKCYKKYHGQSPSSVLRGM